MFCRQPITSTFSAELITVKIWQLMVRVFGLLFGDVVGIFKDVKRAQSVVGAVEGGIDVVRADAEAPRFRQI